MVKQPYVSWHGIWVTAKDAIELYDDLVIFGNAMVESTGDGYGRRIDPRDFYIQKRDKKDD